MLDDEVDRMRGVPLNDKSGVIPIVIAAFVEDPLGVLVVEGRINPVDPSVEVVEKAGGRVGQRFAGDDGARSDGEFAVDDPGTAGEGEVGGHNGKTDRGKNDGDGHGAGKRGERGKEAATPGEQGCSGAGEKQGGAENGKEGDKLAPKSGGNPGNGVKEGIPIANGGCGGITKGAELRPDPDGEAERDGAHEGKKKRRNNEIGPRQAQEGVSAGHPRERKEGGHDAPTAHAVVILSGGEGNGDHGNSGPDTEESNEIKGLRRKSVRTLTDGLNRFDQSVNGTGKKKSPWHPEEEMLGVELKKRELAGIGGVAGVETSAKLLVDEVGGEEAGIPGGHIGIPRDKEQKKDEYAAERENGTEPSAPVGHEEGGHEND